MTTGFKYTNIKALFLSVHEGAHVQTCKHFTPDFKRSLNSKT